MSQEIHTLLHSATGTGAGEPVNCLRIAAKGNRASFHVVGSTTGGTGAATVYIQATNFPDDSDSWVTVATLTLSLSTSETADALVTDVPWVSMRAYVQTINGTGASVSLRMAL